MSRPLLLLLSRVGLVLLVGALGRVPVAHAQDDAGPPPMTEAKIDTAGPGGGYGNNIAGEFTPGRGFDIIKTDRGSLNISVYGLFRYVNQLPANQTFTDHLGRVRTVNTRNDLNWHRTMIWLTGFFYDTRFRYNITGWSLATTQQTLIFGNLQYLAGRALTMGVGIAPNLTNRSMMGSWPFWAASDRQMTEEALRGGFSSGFWLTGQPIDRFYYNVSVNNNLSQLGVVAANDTRDLATSASMWWMPTTGEFGPRGGFGDLEHHDQLATRFGVSGCTSYESRYAPLGSPPNATQIKLSDGLNPFDLGALADNVTVTRLRYQEAGFDAGAKLKGFSIQAEYMIRRLSNFEATGPVPINSNYDRGAYVEAMHMVVPKHLGIYGVTSYIWDEFQRHPWEVAGGASFYPYGSRSWRLNLHFIHVEKSPASSTFGYYTAGQTGNTISLGTDILL
ncbi:MAG TPA: hypothetical protein VMJ70_11505 [Candidatus Sulfotelmatobacter sp.]|nr:hypothetical protein [Candidatus Sulfotelmatobacter sp.]